MSQMTKKEARALEVAANKRAAFEKRVRALLGHVGGKVAKAEVDAAFAKADPNAFGEAADQLAAEIASREPVGRAVHALKEDACLFAEGKARDVAERVRKELRENGWDIEKAAPYPRRGHVGSFDYEKARARYSLFHRLTEPDPKLGYQSSRPGASRIVVMSEKQMDRFIDEAIRSAALQYDAFICKMVGKVGPAKDAVLEGSHVWGDSTLTVTLADGSTERWHTQQIVNQTKYGQPYLQWPSRRMK